MKSAVVDKIASVAQHNALGTELRLSPEIPCEEGVLIAARVLNNKSRYNQLELTSGRMATVNQGDVIVGALGHRKALRGYSGHLPTKLLPGDTIQILNIGGVLGHCDSANPDVGPPFDCEVLGTVLSFPYLGERIGVPARAGAGALDDDGSINANNVPVIALAGTCMDSGKTAAACAIVGRLRHLGYNVAACKGLAAKSPDAIVLELGDGLLGAYGVEAILSDEAIRDALTVIVLCANDPVSAWGGAKILRNDFNIEPAVVTGPATDNDVGVQQIDERLALPAINALSNGVALGDLIADLLDKEKR
jgi:hypothetical protein